MDNEEVSGVKFSEFPAEAPDISDEIVGLHSGNNARFSISNLIFATRQGLASLFVPLTRRINNKALSSDISLTASDVGARANDWMPTAAQVGARPDTWTPSAQDVGAVPVASVGVAGGVPNLDEIGRVPQNQLPPYPTVPAASTANPQMDGAASPGSTGNWADGGHVHPTDTTRVPTSRTINGYDLTQDRSLTAADVGALASGGTAVGAKKLVYDHQVATSGGWYKVFELSSAEINRSYAMTMLIDNGYYNRFGILSFYLNHTSGGDLTGSARWMATTFPLTEFRYTVDNTTKTFTLYAYQSQGRLYFRILSADSRSPSDTYFNPSQCWKSVSVSEPTTATLVYAPIGYAIQYTSVTVSAGTNQQIVSITDARINDSFTLARIEWANPSYITAGYTWTTAAGSFELSGTATASTTANILLVRRVT